jgi:integrase
MKLPTQVQARDRVLRDDELRWFWQASDEVEWPFGPLFNLLLLTAQRRDEVATMSWSDDLEKRVWTIPRHKAKNDRAHEVQLSEAAVAVVGRDDFGQVIDFIGAPDRIRTCDLCLRRTTIHEDVT